MMNTRLPHRALFIASIFFSTAYTARASPVTLPDMPAYTWYHGCAPTSIAMLFGYYDIRYGYTNLFTAKGSALYQTVNVEDQISSPAHNAKYDYVDNPSLPTPPMTSIADYCGTSIDPQAFGDTDGTKIAAAISGYATFEGYTFNTASIRYSSLWATLISQINAGNPMLFYVDTDGDGVYDHFVPVFGYDDRGLNGGDWYACYTTGSENETPVWEQFRPLANGNIYGVYGAIEIAAQPIPEPATLTLLLVSSSALLLRKRARSAS